MKLMTKALQKRFAKVGSQQNVDDPVVIARYYTSIGRGIWLATEYDPKTQTFFGYVSIYGDWNDEWGYFSLKELENFEGPFGLKIERDLNFQEDLARWYIDRLY